VNQAVISVHEVLQINQLSSHFFCLSTLNCSNGAAKEEYSSNCSAVFQVWILVYV